jgi:hypothetical protein
MPLLQISLLKVIYAIKALNILKTLKVNKLA